jgi:hypothetical protein
MRSGSRLKARLPACVKQSPRKARRGADLPTIGAEEPEAEGPGTNECWHCDQASREAGEIILPGCHKGTDNFELPPAEAAEKPMLREGTERSP